MYLAKRLKSSSFAHSPRPGPVRISFLTLMRCGRELGLGTTLAMELIDSTCSSRKLDSK